MLWMMLPVDAGAAGWEEGMRPSCPVRLRPQAYSSPAADMARLWASPAAMAVTGMPQRPSTATGMKRVLVSLWPSYPNALPPHVNTTPADESAMEWCPPAATCTTRTPRRALSRRGFGHCSGASSPMPHCGAQSTGSVRTPLPRLPRARPTAHPPHSQSSKTASPAPPRCCPSRTPRLPR